MSRNRNVENSSGNWKDIEFSGTNDSVSKRPDTYVMRHQEAGLFVWRWVLDKIRGVRIEPVLHPLLGHSRSALRVYRDLVNCVVYRKPHHRVTFQSNGVSRHDDLGRCLKNYCPHCSEDVAGTRVTRGCYLPIEHDCPRVRVYDLRGKLLEVL